MGQWANETERQNALALGEPAAVCRKQAGK